MLLHLPFFAARTSASLIGGEREAAGFDPEADAWMSSLSAQPPVHACRLIEERLNMLEASGLPVVQFVPALGLIQDAIGTTQTRIDSALPRTEMRFEAVDLDLVRAILALRKRTASAFLAAAERLEDRWFRRGTRSIRDSALQQGALAVLQRVELAHRIYARTSASGWQQLARISAIALSGKARVDPAARTEIARLHTRALLFELADPNRLDPVSFEHLRMYLRRHGGHAQIVRLKGVPVENHQAAGLHLLAYAGRHLQPLARVATAQVPPDTLVLDARGLLKRLERQLAGLSAGVDTARLGLPRDARQPRYRDFLVSLAERWAQRSPRRHGRNRFLPRTRVAIGYEAARAFLDARDGLPASPIAQRAISEWTILNESPSGFGLALIAPTSGIRIGEACCLRPDGRTDAHLGVIRRAEHRGPRDIVIGIELLGAGPAAARLRTESEWTSDTDGTPVIRFARAGAMGGPALLCRTGRLAEGSRVIVVLDGEAGRHRIGPIITMGATLELGALLPDA